MVYSRATTSAIADRVVAGFFAALDAVLGVGMLTKKGSTILVLLYGSSLDDEKARLTYLLQQLDQVIIWFVDLFDLNNLWSLSSLKEDQ